METEPKILILLPFIADDEEFKAYNRKYVFPPDVDVRGLSVGRRKNESPADCAVVLREELKAVIKAEQDGYDAVVVGCFLDTGVREAREAANIPVFGTAHTALCVSQMLAHRTGIITTSIYVRRGIEANLREWKTDDRTVVRCVGSTPDALMSGLNDRDVIMSVADACGDVIEKDDAGAIILGCGGFYGIAAEVKAEIQRRGYDVPFIDSHRTAVEVARTLCKLGLKQSRVTYPQLGGYEW